MNTSSLNYFTLVLKMHNLKSLNSRPVVLASGPEVDHSKIKV